PYSSVCWTAPSPRRPPTADYPVTVVAPLPERQNEHCSPLPRLPAGRRVLRVPPAAPAGLGRADCRGTGGLLAAGRQRRRHRGGGHHRRADRGAAAAAADPPALHQHATAGLLHQDPPAVV